MMMNPKDIGTVVLDLEDDTSKLHKIKKRPLLPWSEKAPHQLSKMDPG